MQRFIVSIIVGICFLKKKRPKFDWFQFLVGSHQTDIDEKRNLVSLIIHYSRDIIVDDYVFPDIFLKNFHQVNPKLTHLLNLKDRF